MNTEVRPWILDIVLANNRGITKIDDTDYTATFKYTWRDGYTAELRPCDLSWRINQDGYAVTSVKCADKKQRGLLLHRLIMSAPPNTWVDHINRDRLDNRRSTNLRFTNPSQSTTNSSRINSNGYCGVYKPKRRSKKPHYRASIQKDGNTVCLGTYSTAREAALAYDNAARELHGDHAILNFPDEYTTLTQCNPKSQIPRLSLYKFTYYCWIRRKWVVKIWLNGKNVYIGSYETEHEAYQAADAAYRAAGRPDGIESVPPAKGPTLNESSVLEDGSRVILVQTKKRGAETQEHRVIIDDADYTRQFLYTWPDGYTGNLRVCDLVWHLYKSHGNKYTIATIKDRDRKERVASLHRLLMNAPT